MYNLTSNASPNLPAGAVFRAFASAARHQQCSRLKPESQRIAICVAEILEQTRGVFGGKGGAAEGLGLPTSTLRNRMKKLGLR